MKKNSKIFSLVFLLAIFILSGCKISAQSENLAKKNSSDTTCILCCEDKFISDSTYCIHTPNYEGVILYSDTQLVVLKRSQIKNILFDSLWSPNTNNIEALEGGMPLKYKSEYWPKLNSIHYYPDSLLLHTYFRQYVGVYSLNGEKLIIASFIRVTSKEDFIEFYSKAYIKKFIRVHDANGSFFMLKFNPLTKEYLDFIYY